MGIRWPQLAVRVVPIHPKDSWCRNGLVQRLTVGRKHVNRHREVDCAGFVGIGDGEDELIEERGGQWVRRDVAYPEVYRVLERDGHGRWLHAALHCDTPSPKCEGIKAVSVHGRNLRSRLGERWYRVARDAECFADRVDIRLPTLVEGTDPLTLFGVTRPGRARDS